MDKKHKILSSALELFVSKGFHGTATAAVAKKADVSNGTLFHYFSSKNELVQELYNQIKSEQITVISGDFNPQGQPKQQFELIWNKALRWAYENEVRYHFLLQYKYSPYRKKQPATLSKFKDDFAFVVEKAIQQKQMRYMPADYVFEMTNASVYGMVNYLRANPVKYRTPEFMRQSFEWFWQGLRP